MRNRTENTDGGLWFAFCKYAQTDPTVTTSFQRRLACLAIQKLFNNINNWKVPLIGQAQSTRAVDIFCTFCVIIVQFQQH